MAEINTNISVSERQAQAFKRFQTTSANEQPLPQGDGSIKISPFDDYFLFTLYEDIEGEDRPIDLSMWATSTSLSLATMIRSRSHTTPMYRIWISHRAR